MDNIAKVEFLALFNCEYQLFSMVFYSMINDAIRYQVNIQSHWECWED